jgi:hypothetical protein
MPIGTTHRSTISLAATALAIQVLTGLWMGWIVLPGFQGLFNPANPIGMLVGVKLLLLAGITALAIAFVVVGSLIRLGGSELSRGWIARWHQQWFGAPCR